MHAMRCPPNPFGSICPLTHLNPCHASLARYFSIAQYQSQPGHMFQCHFANWKLQTTTQVRPLTLTHTAFSPCAQSGTFGRSCVWVWVWLCACVRARFLCVCVSVDHRIWKWFGNGRTIKAQYFPAD